MEVGTLDFELYWCPKFYKYVLSLVGLKDWVLLVNLGWFKLEVVLLIIISGDVH